MAAAVRMRDNMHLTPEDIGQCLKLSTAAVRELLYLADHGIEKHGSNTNARRHHRSD
jgi:hypothetical protein